MGKQGPCCHCGVTSTPLWRNGPPEKPVLCNACGSRWRTRGTLSNYIPQHACENFGFDAPMSSHKSREPLLGGPVEHFGQPRKRRITCMSDKRESFVELDTSNRSSSGSGISYSEGCRDRFSNIDAGDWTGSAQSTVLEMAPPSKRLKNASSHPRLSQVEKLRRELHAILHEQSSIRSVTSEDELFYPSSDPMDSFEKGYGSVPIQHPESKSADEESEASSIPNEGKVPMKHGVSSFVCPPIPILGATSRKSGTSDQATVKFKKTSTKVAQDSAKSKGHVEKPQLVRNADSLLMSVDLADIVNYENFSMHLTSIEQEKMMKYLPSIDAMELPQSLMSMFSSTQFTNTFGEFQGLIKEGILGYSSSRVISDDRKLLKSLMMSNLMKSKWVECYQLLKDKESENARNATGGGTSDGANSTSVPVERFSPDGEIQDILPRSPKTVSEV